jgi:hypothetical protein
MLLDIELPNLVGKHAMLGKKPKIWIIDRFWQDLPDPKNPIMKGITFILVRPSKKRNVKPDRKRLKVDFRKMGAIRIDDDSVLITFGRSQLNIILLYPTLKDETVTTE